MLELFANSAMGASLITAAVPLCSVPHAGGCGCGMGQGRPRRRRYRPVPPTVFNARLTPRRAVAFASIRLAH